MEGIEQLQDLELFLFSLHLQHQARIVPPNNSRSGTCFSHRPLNLAFITT